MRYDLSFILALIRTVVVPFCEATKKSIYQSSASITKRIFCLFIQNGKKNSNGRYLTLLLNLCASSKPVFVITLKFISSFEKCSKIGFKALVSPMEQL